MNSWQANPLNTIHYEHCPDCDSTPWCDWIAVGVKSMFYQSLLCRECLEHKNKLDELAIMSYLYRYANSGFSVWSSIASCTFSNNLYYDPRGDFAQLSDLEFGNVENKSI